MIIKSDWHIHSEYSYDAQNKLEDLLAQAKKQGLVKMGITDHLNFNDDKFIGDIVNSANGVKSMQTVCQDLVLGVELTPIAKPEFDYIAIHKTRDGYEEKHADKPYDITLALTKDELKALGIRYAVGAAHWRVDVPKAERVVSSADMASTRRKSNRFGASLVSRKSHLVRRFFGYSALDE